LPSFGIFSAVPKSLMPKCDSVQYQIPERSHPQILVCFFVVDRLLELSYFFRFGG
jgi:hypothetical protein